MTRVVVTGLGVSSPLGETLDEFWASVASGQSGIRAFDFALPSKLRFGYGAFFCGDREGFKDEPESVYFQRAANSALDTAQLDSVANTALCVGAAAAGQRTLDRTFKGLNTGVNPRLLPSTLMRFQANRAATDFAQSVGLHGPNYTICSGCSSSAQAIGLGLDLIRSGRVKSAVVGGTEAPFAWVSLKSWEALRVVDKEPCRPFCASRAGLNLGEGAGALVLESLESAKRRKTPIFAELRGYFSNTSGAGQAGVSVEGPSLCMEGALRDADLSGSDIGYINAHGTGTRLNDLKETKAIHRLFGQHARNLAVSSTKSLHGHTLGAAGAIEAITTILALRHQAYPPTINFSEQDPDCDLDYVTEGKAREGSFRFALSNSFAFGGSNATLVFEKW